MFVTFILSVCRFLTARKEHCYYYVFHLTLSQSPQEKNYKILRMTGKSERREKAMSTCSSFPSSLLSHNILITDNWEDVRCFITLICLIKFMTLSCFVFETKSSFYIHPQSDCVSSVSSLVPVLSILHYDGHPVSQQLQALPLLVQY